MKCRREKEDTVTPRRRTMYRYCMAVGWTRKKAIFPSLLIPESGFGCMFKYKVGIKV
jgi:hypothetical protein